MPGRPWPPRTPLAAAATPIEPSAAPSGAVPPSGPLRTFLRASTAVRESKVTVKIPRPLYRKIQQVVEDSGFNSPTDFVVYVLRDLMGEAPASSEHRSAQSGGTAPSGASAAPHANGAGDYSPEELEEVRRKLKNLGYL